MLRIMKNKSISVATYRMYLFSLVHRKVLIQYPKIPVSPSSTQNLSYTIKIIIISNMHESCLRDCDKMEYFE